MNIPLKYAESFPATWSKLGEIERTGWIRRGVKNPETVQEHSISCIQLILTLRDKLTEFSDDEIWRLTNMLEIHDYAEYLAGDIVTIANTKEESDKLKGYKYEREQDAMNKISELGQSGKEVCKLWDEFEDNKSKVAKLANQIDKFQAIEKAFEYEMNGEKVSTMEFINHAKPHITHPLLIERVKEIEEKLTTTNI